MKASESSFIIDLGEDVVGPLQERVLIKAEVRKL